MTVKETLVAARELIADESKWTSYAWGRDANGYDLSKFHLYSAIKFCALGALMKVDGPHEEEALIQLDITAQSMFKRKAITVNDELGHEAVLKLYDEAIASADEGGRS